MSNNSKKHVIAVVEGVWDNLFLEELIGWLKLGYKIIKIRYSRGEVHNKIVREIRTLRRNSQPYIIILPCGGKNRLRKITWKVIRDVTEYNGYLQTQLIRALIIFDQNNYPSPSQAINRFIELLRKQLSPHNVQIQKLQDGGNYTDIRSIIGEENSPTSFTALSRIIVINNSIECELVRVVLGEYTSNRRKCHDILREKIKQETHSGEDKKREKVIREIIAYFLNKLEQCNQLCSWYRPLKEFLDDE